jgi:hypothetical protein
MDLLSSKIGNPFHPFNPRDHGKRNMKAKRRNVDDDEFVPVLQKNLNQKDTTVLSRHKDEIIKMHQDGNKPKVIAQTLCVKEGLKAGSISPKDVSNYLGNFKRSGMLKTYKVSLKNKNLRADDDDNCMNINFLLYERKMSRVF